MNFKKKPNPSASEVTEIGAANIGRIKKKRE